MESSRRIHCLLLLALTTAWGCAYQYPAGPLQPSQSQGEETTLSEDGGITFNRGRLAVTLRPLTDEELDRQTQVIGGVSTYTFGDVEFEDGLTRSRFTVFLLKVKNYEFRKVVIDPSQLELIAGNGRQYWSLNHDQLETYFRSFAVGYRGKEYAAFQERVELLDRTMFEHAEVFSGQESEGYVVFPLLHEDVSSIHVTIHDAALRFDPSGVPVETVDIDYHLERPVSRRSWREPPERTASVAD